MESREMTEQMKARAQLLAMQASLASSRLQTYLEGCKDGLGLKGDWNVDTTNWTFNKIEKPEQPEQGGK